MKSLSIYRNLYSRVASGEISDAQWVEGIRNGHFREMTEEFRRLKAEGKEKEASALKKEMMAVLFAGVCKEGRSFDLTTERTGWAMFDFDRMMEDQIRAVRGVLKVCPWVVMAYVTVSGRGLRVVVNIGMVDKEVYRDVYVSAAEKLKRLTGAEPDMQCKDFARLSVGSYDPDIYYNPDAEVLEYVKCDSAPEQRVKRLNGVNDIDAVLDRFFFRWPLVAGSRHNTLLKLGRYLKWWNLDAGQLDRAVGAVCSMVAGMDMTVKEVTDAIRWGFEKGTAGPPGRIGSQGSSGSYGQYNNGRKNGFMGDESLAEHEERVMERYCTNIPDSVYGCLPESLKKLLVIAKDRTERDILLLSALGIMSGVFTWLRTMYGNMLYSPHLYVTIIAPPGSGKGLASHSMRLGRKIDRVFAERYAAEMKIYEDRLRKWEAGLKLAAREKRTPDVGLKPQPPRRQVLTMEPNSSKSQFILTMKWSGDAGNIVAASEIDSLNSSLATDYGKHLPELRMAFHHEPIGQNYKVDGEQVEIDNPRLAMVIVGTVQQYMNFVPNVEDGMNSRLAPFISSRRSEWKSQSPLCGNGGIDAARLVDELGEKLKDFFFDNEGNIIMVNFTEEQWNRHTERFERLMAMVLAECVEGTEAIVVRSGLIAIRMAMVFCGLRLMESGRRVKNLTCSDTDFDAAMDIATNCLKHSIHLTTLYNNGNRRKRMEAFFRKLKVLEGMKAVFTYSEFVGLGREMGFSESSMKRALKMYLDSDLIERNGTGYRRLKRGDEGIY